MISSPLTPTQITELKRADLSVEIRRDSRVRLTLYRALVLCALFSYPFVPKLLFWCAHRPWPALSVLAVGAGMTWALMGFIGGMLALSAMIQVKPGERERRAVAREAMLGAVGPPLLIFLDKLIPFIPGRPDRSYVWWLVVATVVLWQFLPLRKSKYSSEKTNRKIHLYAAYPLMLFGLFHIANHLTALHSFRVATAVQHVLRKGYQNPVAECVLAAAAIVLVVTGIPMLLSARLAPGTFLRNLMILSASNLSVFVLLHMYNIVVQDRIQRGDDPTLQWLVSIGKGSMGMFSTPGRPAVVPYYFLGVVAVFIHVGGGCRWLLAPYLGPKGAERFAYGTMIVGVVAAIGILCTMANLHFGA